MMNARLPLPTVVIYGFATLLAIGLGGWYCSPASTEVPVSRETTYLTQPLLPNGQVNYALAILQQQKEEATPENNGAIALLQATWPCDMPPNLWNSICREMEFDIPAEPGLQMPYHAAYAENFGRWLLTQTSDPDQRVTRQDLRIRNLLLAASKNRWSREQFPPLADWVAEQSVHLDKLRDIHTKSNFYLPMVLLIDYPRTELTSIRAPANQQIRIVAEALSIRAMYRLGEHHPAAAWRDIETIYALSQMRSAIPALIELNTSYMVCDRAIAATHALVTSGECEAGLLAQIENRVDALATFDQTRLAVTEYERLIALDTARRGVSRQRAAEVSIPAFNATAMMIRLNEDFDRISAALENKNDLERRVLLKKLAAEFSASAAPRSLTNELVNSWRLSAEGNRTADGIVAVLLPSVMQICIVESRTNTYLKLLHVAISLQQHQQQTGQYPENLLAILDQQHARDPYSDGPLQYHRRHQGYLLYSVFENQTDDTIDSLHDDGADSQLAADSAIPNLDIRLAAPAPTFKSQLEAEIQQLSQ